MNNNGITLKIKQSLSLLFEEVHKLNRNLPLYTIYLIFSRLSILFKTIAHAEDFVITVLRGLEY